MFSGSIFYEKRRVFWIETGDPLTDQVIVAMIAKDRAACLRTAKAGEDGIVDGDEVRFLREAAKLAAVVSGQVSADEILEEAGNGDGLEKEPARVLPFEVKK